MTTRTTRPSAGGCPFPHGTTHRKTDRGESPDAPAIERRGDVWHLRAYAAVRQVLRDADATRQAIPIGEPAIFRLGLRKPVIYQDGPPHREQRTAIARFFTPKTVSESYQALMDELSDRLVGELERAGSADLSALTVRLATEVAAQVIGLTDSRAPGLDRRLDRLLSGGAAPASPAHRAVGAMRNGADMLRFYLQDVRPAIVARRREPREDVISHLLDAGYNDAEIFVECITYSVAGMTTTREFIGMAAWHLLENGALRREYLEADEEERHRILHEILRLEPVASELYRRAVKDLRIEHDGETHLVPAGALLFLDIRTANIDADAVGDVPLAVCPRRGLARGVQPPAMSFGDGAHRCPGTFVAIQESDTFLLRLLRLPLRVRGAPNLGWNEKLKSYEVRDFVIGLDPEAAARPPREGARPLGGGGGSA